MTAFFIATATIKNREKLQEYGGKAAQSFAPFNGELVVRGKAGATLAGASDHQVVAMVRFPDMKALEGWYHSSDYQALIALRNEAADMTLVAYEEVT